MKSRVAVEVRRHLQRSQQRRDSDNTPAVVIGGDNPQDGGPMVPDVATDPVVVYVVDEARRLVDKVLVSEVPALLEIHHDNSLPLAAGLQPCPSSVDPGRSSV